MKKKTFLPFAFLVKNFPKKKMSLNSRPLSATSISFRDLFRCCFAEEDDIFPTAFEQCFLCLLSESQGAPHLLVSTVQEQIEYLFFQPKISTRNSTSHKGLLWDWRWIEANSKSLFRAGQDPVQSRTQILRENRHSKPLDLPKLLMPKSTMTKSIFSNL